MNQAQQRRAGHTFSMPDARRSTPFLTADLAVGIQAFVVVVFTTSELGVLAGTRAAIASVPAADFGVVGCAVYSQVGDGWSKHDTPFVRFPEV